jgi:Ty3 transposon capsid-like protein
MASFIKEEVDQESVANNHLYFLTEIGYFQTQLGNLGEGKTYPDEILEDLPNGKLLKILDILKQKLSSKITEKNSGNREQGSYKRKERNKRMTEMINTPNTYSGNKKKTEEFFGQIENFLFQARFGSSEKIIFMKSYLRGYAAEWTTSVLSINENILTMENGFSVFLHSFRDEFSDKWFESKLVEKQEKIKMGDDFPKFKQEFLSLSRKGEFSNEILRTWFLRALPKRIKLQLHPSKCWPMSQLLDRVNNCVDYMESMHLDTWKTTKENDNRNTQSVSNITCSFC